MKKYVRQFAGRSLVVIGAVSAVASTSTSAFAQTDLGTTITTVSGYWTSVEALAIGILLFVLGRRILKKL